MSITKFFKDLANKFSLSKRAQQAEDKKTSVLARVRTAEATLRAERKRAVGELKSEQSAVSEAIKTADAIEAQRETARGQEVAETEASNKATLDALIAALEQAKRNADEAIKELKAEHDGERAASASARQAAEQAIIDLAAAQAAIEKASC